MNVAPSVLWGNYQPDENTNRPMVPKLSAPLQTSESGCSDGDANNALPWDCVCP